MTNRKIPPESFTEFWAKENDKRRLDAERKHERHRRELEAMTKEELIRHIMTPVMSYRTDYNESAARGAYLQKYGIDPHSTEYFRIFDDLMDNETLREKFGTLQ